MSRTQIKNGNAVWDAFMRVVVLAPFGGVGWATTRQIAEISGKSKPTVQRYMTAACETGAASSVRLSSGQVVWVWEK